MATHLLELLSAKESLGQSATQKVVELSANDPQSVQFSTHCLVLFSPKELLGHLNTQVLVVFSANVQGLLGQTSTHLLVESSAKVLFVITTPPEIFASGQTKTQALVTISA